jgi:uncharacterized damage-inducible protein DinB
MSASVEAKTPGGKHPTGEAAGLAEELRSLWQGDAWHGPALAELLDGVSAGQATARPVPGGHSIWELVLHTAAWTDVFRRRLEGQPLDEPEDGDFPPVPEATAESWRKAQDRLRGAHERLAERVARLGDGELDSPVRGRDYSARFLVRGAIRHVVYHSGQIGLLRKAQ